jgi:hypothetical protein
MNETQCDTRPRAPCYACGDAGPNGYYCLRPRGHDGEHKAITRTAEEADDDVIQWSAT